MAFKALDTVVLMHDLPEHSLRAGDLGAVVHVSSSDELEVEFVTASDRTEAVATLRSSDVRAIESSDMIAVRSVKRSA